MNIEDDSETELLALNESMSVSSDTAVDKSNIQNGSKKVNVLLNNLNHILNYFKNNRPSNILETSDEILSYPKFLTTMELFDLQIQNSSFRKVYLLQVLVMLKSFLNPISPLQKSVLIFSDQDKKTIGDLIVRAESIIKSLSSKFYCKVIQLFKNEEYWEKWKEDFCKSFEKLPDETLVNDLTSIRENLMNNKENEFHNQYMNKKILNDLYQDQGFKSQFYVDLREVVKFSYERNYDQGFRTESPLLGHYIERAIKDNDPDLEMEEDCKMKTSPVRSIYV